MYKGYFKNLKQNEHGVTLIEILASIVLLTMLISFMFNIFIQSATVNNTSEHIINATYAAQTYMEKIYGISTYTNFNDKKDAIKNNLGIENGNITIADQAISFTLTEGDKDITIKVDEDINLYRNGIAIPNINNMTRVTVKVLNLEGDTEATLDNVIEWKGE